MSEQPAGWYVDPQDPAQARWYDGATWTEHTQPAGPSVPAPQQPARSRFPKRLALAVGAVVVTAGIGLGWAFSPGGPIAEARFDADAEESDRSWYAAMLRDDASPAFDGMTDKQLERDAAALCASLKKQGIARVTTEGLIRMGPEMARDKGITEQQARYVTITSVTWKCPDRAGW